MDFERMLHKASVVRFSSGRCTEDHFVGVTQVIRRNKLPGQGDMR